VQAERGAIGWEQWSKNVGPTARTGRMSNSELLHSELKGENDKGVKGDRLPGEKKKSMLLVTKNTAQLNAWGAEVRSKGHRVPMPINATGQKPEMRGHNYQHLGVGGRGRATLTLLIRGETFRGRKGGGGIWNYEGISLSVTKRRGVMPCF